LQLLSKRKEARRIMKLKEIIGFPYYMMDVETGNLYSCFDGLRELGARKKGSDKLWYSLRRDGCTFSFSQNRLWYAALNDIPVDRIPRYVQVKRTEDGQFHLMSYRERAEHMNKVMAENSTKNRMAILERRAKEIGILMRCYESSNYKEAYEYIMGIKKEIIARYRRSYGGNSDTAQALFDVAVDLMMSRLRLPSCRMSDLTNNVIKNMHKEHEKMRLQRRATAEWMYQQAKKGTQINMSIYENQ
jgi:hypothetical protein